MMTMSEHHPTRRATRRDEGQLRDALFTHFAGEALILVSSLTGTVCDAASVRGEPEALRAAALEVSIDVGGTVAGVLRLRFDARAAALLAESFIGAAAAGSEAMRRDALCELANVVAGLAAGAFEADDRSITISPPRCEQPPPARAIGASCRVGAITIPDRRGRIELSFELAQPGE